MINLKEEKDVQIWCDYQEETRQTSANYFLRLRFANFRTFIAKVINCGDGDEYGFGNGFGDGNNYGNGFGNGYGLGYGDSWGNGWGCGNNFGSRSGDSFGSGDGVIDGDGYGGGDNSQY